MTDDPLAQFRPKDPMKPQPGSGPEGYEAFKSVDRRQIRLQIRAANKAWERLPYGSLLRIVEDGQFGTELVLVYGFMVVVILGQNLQEIGNAIGDERCDFIQEFDRDKWSKPEDGTRPFIESIEYHQKKTVTDVLAESGSRIKH